MSFILGNGGMEVKQTQSVYYWHESETLLIESYFQSDTINLFYMIISNLVFVVKSQPNIEINRQPNIEIDKTCDLTL